LAGLVWSVLFFILLNAFENIPIKPDRKFAFFSKMKYLVLFLQF
jgi:hypothetical protein